MTPATLARVPNQPKTPQRTIRIADDVWDAAKAKAEANGRTVSDVIREALARYLRSSKA
jgi:predicted CopG family antitoxin